jgi:hypothetical protein
VFSFAFFVATAALVYYQAETMPHGRLTGVRAAVLFVLTAGSLGASLSLASYAPRWRPVVGAGFLLATLALLAWIVQCAIGIRLFPAERGLELGIPGYTVLAAYAFALGGAGITAVTGER